MECIYANDSTYITLCIKIKYFLGHIKIFLLQIIIYWLVGHKSILSVSNANLFA